MNLLRKSYSNTLIKYPVLMQAVQTGLLMGTGDIISQTIIEKKQIKNITWSRTAQFTSVGFLFAGPTLRTWYGILNKYVGSGGTKVTVKKVFLDQLLFAPVFLGSILFVINGVQGQTIQQNATNVKETYPDVLFNNYKVWPWVQLANFYLTPLNYQVLVVQFVAIFWNTYISWRINLREKIV